MSVTAQISTCPVVPLSFDAIDRTTKNISQGVHEKRDLFLTLFAREFVKHFSVSAGRTSDGNCGVLGQRPIRIEHAYLRAIPKHAVRIKDKTGIATELMSWRRILFNVIGYTQESITIRRQSAKFVLFACCLILQPFRALHLGKNGVTARTCLDYVKEGIFENGFYWLFDEQENRYVAYCDLSSEPGAAWTLVISWNRASKNLPHFRSKAFKQDAPINQNTPNWSVYRQTLARMNGLRSRSTHWRATCSFNLVSGIDYRDYVRGKFSQLDIMAYLGRGRCFTVDYVNIRGHAAGSGTTAPFWQILDIGFLHIDSSHTRCTFKPNAGSVRSEDNFGYYGNINANFRCTSGNDATTQWWFGGYLA